MSGDPPGDNPDATLRTAYASLRRGAHADALSLLTGLTFPDRPAAAARVASFRAQALDGLGRLPEAERAAAEAVRLAKKVGDVDGWNATRTLHARLLASLAATETAARARAADRPLVDIPDETLLAEAPAPSPGISPRAAVLIRKANALADAERDAEALTTVLRAEAEARAAGDTRESVFAILCQVRVARSDAEALIRRAHAVADAADDPNLITAVAHAARAAGVRLPGHAFA